MVRLPFGLSPKPRKTGTIYGDIYPRAVAAGIDLAILFLILNDLFHYATAWFYQGVDMELFAKIKATQRFSEMAGLLWSSHFAPLWLLNFLFQILVIGILFVSVQILWGTTPGKWLIGLKIVRAKTLAPVAKWRYVLRYFAYIPAVAPLMIGIFWMGFNPERRGWHDFIAGTVVLNTRPEGWYLEKVKRGYWRLRGRKANANTPQNIA